MKTVWIFLFIIAALIMAAVLGNYYEGFAIAVTDSSGNTTNYATHTSQGSSTFSSTTDASGNKTFDNYNHYDGTSTNAITGTTYYGPNGGSATVITTADGKQAIRVTLPSDPTPIDYIYVTVNKWQGPNGEATLVRSSNGGDALKISLNNGTTYLYVISPGGNVTTADNSAGTASYETTYYGSTGTPPPPQSNYYAYDQPISSTGTPPPPPPPPPPQSNSDGIPRSMIAPGQEDLYILKSAIVFPSCPACPPVINTKCPPPPPPMFSYNTMNMAMDTSTQQQQQSKYSAANTSLPMPVLNSFATFGM